MSFCQGLLKISVVIRERLSVYTKVCDQITNLSMAVAYLICDQVEAAFLMSFVATQGMFFFLYSFLGLFVFVYVTDKLLNCSNLCVCV